MIEPLTSQSSTSIDLSASVQNLCKQATDACDRGDFVCLEEKLVSFDELLTTSCRCNLLSPFEVLVSVKDLPATVLIECVSRVNYAQAFDSLVHTKNTEVATQLFERVTSLLNQLEKVSDIYATSGLAELRWRARYHAALAQNYGDKKTEAKQQFEQILDEGEFRTSLEQLAESDSLADKTIILKVPADVVSGTLVHLGQIYFNSRLFDAALPLLEYASKITREQICIDLGKLIADDLEICRLHDRLRSNYVGSAKLNDYWLKQVTIEVRPADQTHGQASQTNFVNPKKDSYSKKAAKARSISAVIPVYNGRKHLQEAIESICTQTYAPVELVIIDDGSADNSFDFLRSVSCNVKLIIVRTLNSGQSTARNVAVSLATGELIAFLDQDDIWYRSHLEDLHRPFIQNDELTWTYADLDEIDIDGKMVSRNFLRVVAPDRKFNTLTSLLRDDMFILPSASLILKEALIKVHGFDEELSGYEDDDLFIRLFRDGYEHQFVDKSLSKWRIHPGSCSYEIRMTNSRRKFFAKLFAEYKDQPAMGKWWVRDVLAPRYLSNAMNRYRMGLDEKDYVTCKMAAEDMRDAVRRMRVSMFTRLVIDLYQNPQLILAVKTVRGLCRRF